MEISNQNKSIEEILEWYRVTQNSLDKNEELIISNRNMTIERFIGSSQNEVHAYFRYASNELALMVCFDLLSAVEAALKLDYYVRVERRKKEEISKFFREKDKGSKGKVSFDGTILAAWKEYYPACRHKIGAYRGLLDSRNWIAHGRLWKFDTVFDVDIVYQICDDVIKILPLETA